MLLDAFLLLFGFTAWWLYALYRNTNAFGYLLGAAIFAGLAVSVKWTGLTFLGIIGLLELLRLRWKNVLVLIFLPFAIYFSIFAVHFSLLNKPGPGDAFMTPAFREGKLSTFQKFLELNAQMYSSNARLTATHPYSSKWYTWPFMLRSIYYWNNGAAKIYLLGNPVVWWASTFGIFYVLLSTLGTRNKILYLISGAYLVNLLPFIGIDRAMFLYHYLTGLVIAILALAYLIDHLKSRTKIFVGLISLSILSFIYFAPITYGRPELTQKQFDHRMWLKSWL